MLIYSLNCNSRYAYQICLFDTERRATGQKFEGLVTSTLKPIESQCAKTSDVSKSEVFVTTFAAARNYTDQWANLNFIIRMKKLVDDEETKKDTENVAGTSLSTNNSSSSQTSSGTGSETNNIHLPSNPSGSSPNHNNQSVSIEINDAEMQFEELQEQVEATIAHGEQLLVNESQLRQSSLTDAINIPIVTSSTS